MTDGTKPGEPVVVARTSTSSEAELIVGFLHSAGVRAEVEDVRVAAYGTTVGSELRVIVPPDSADRALDLLRRADHVDAVDPGSDIDVGLPVDDDVRDYLRWKETTAVDDSPPRRAPEPPVPFSAVDEAHARHLPLLPLLGAIALVAALIVLLH